ILIVGGFFFFRGGSPAVNGNVVSEGGQVLQGETQKVVIGEKNLNYYPNEIKVKAGQPVSISLDSSVTGCLRSFNIKDLGVSKNAKTPSDTINFTPTKKGTFRFACSMGMGYGNIIVK
ncbi:MAG: hypothetical protein US35_C0040G0013, partial [Parcubacteria group bacterium GW2011_GWA2_37_10]